MATPESGLKIPIGQNPALLYSADFDSNFGKNVPGALRGL